MATIQFQNPAGNIVEKVAIVSDGNHRLASSLEVREDLQIKIAAKLGVLFCGPFVEHIDGFVF